MKPFVGSALLGVGLSACMMQALQAAPKNAATKVREIRFARYYTKTASGAPSSTIQTFVFRSDGTAIYYGHPSFVKPFGKLTGRIDSNDFAKLAALVDADFLELPRQIGKPEVVAEGQKITTFRVVAEATVGDKKKQVVTFNSYRPKPLRGLAQIVDGLLYKIRWTRAEPAAGEQEETN